MRTFAQKPKVTQQTTSVGFTKPSRAFRGQSSEVSTAHYLQQTIGNQAVLRLLQSNKAGTAKREPVLQRQMDEEGESQTGTGGQAPALGSAPGVQAGKWKNTYPFMFFGAYDPKPGGGWSISSTSDNGPRDFSPPLKPAVVYDPPKVWAFHTNFGVDGRAAPIPENLKVFDTYADLKFVTTKGATTLDKHFHDPSPDYIAPGSTLNTHPWSFRCTLPISTGGKLTWIAGLTVGDQNVGGVGTSTWREIQFEVRP